MGRWRSVGRGSGLVIALQSGGQGGALAVRLHRREGGETEGEMLLLSRREKPIGS